MTKRLSALPVLGLAAVLAALAVPPAVTAARAPDPVPVPQPTPEDLARFHAFVRMFRTEAIAAGIKPATYDRAMSDITLNPKIEELNEKQPEFVRPVWEYLRTAVSEERVARGRELLSVNAALFQRLERTYGVPPEILAAIWGLETNFGRSTGAYNLFEALATLAFDGPRAAYGRRQLIAALKLVEIEGRDPRMLTSSWAGAFGETQFVATTFLDHAVDGDGDGKRDVWHSPADALASTAHYLQESHWQSGQWWGGEAALPANFPFEMADFDLKKPMRDWSALGVRMVDGNPLPQTDEPAAIFLPAGYRGPAFVLKANFDALLKYNFATAYALAVGLLADRFKGRDGVRGAWPVDEIPLDTTQRSQLQQGLIRLGFDAGGSDGVLGRRTRQAIRDYQKTRGLPADGFATASLLARILEDERPTEPALSPP